jgi:hypothetical protein
MSQENLELVRSIFAACARCQVKTAPKARAAAERLAEKRAQGR